MECLADLFPEYPKDFPASGPFFVNSALVASVAVELGGTNEDMRTRELRSPEIRERADQARAVINTGSRPVAESAVASLRAIKGWSDERFSDWEARVAEQATTAARREEVRHARFCFAVWEACFSVAPDLLQDPTKPLYQGVFERRIAATDKSTLEQIGNELGVTRERIRQIEAHLRRVLSTQAFDVHDPNFEAAATALSETDSATDPSMFAEAMQMLGTTLATEKADDEIRIITRGYQSRKNEVRAEQLARLMSLLAVPVDHLPQNVLVAGGFWMGRGAKGGERRADAWVAAAALDLRNAQELRTKTTAELANAPISVLNLSTRPQNSLDKAGIETVGALMKLTDDQLLGMPSMGALSVSEIRHRVEELVSPSNAPADLASAPIGVLGLSARPNNCLLRARINTVGALMELSDDRLLMISNMGAGSVKEIRERLAALVDADGTARMPQDDPPPGNTPIADLPISVLGLSTRSQNCLQRARIETVGALAELSDDQLLQMWGMGANSVSEIRRRLNELQDRSPV